MTKRNKHRLRPGVVDDLMAGLREKQNELGTEGSRLLQLLRAAGYHDYDELYRSSLTHWSHRQDEKPRRH